MDVVEVAADVGAGAQTAAGNVHGGALSTLGHARVRADQQQFSAAATASFETVHPVVENVEARARYDYFFGKVAPFAQATIRHDRFEGLDLRLNLDPGLAYYFVNDKTMRVQTDVGFDLQYDRPRDKAISNARLFVGYEQKVRNAISVLTDVEYIPSFADLGTYRFVVNVGLKSQVTEHLGIATFYQGRYENRPVSPNVKPFDSIVSLNLVYAFF